MTEAPIKGSPALSTTVPRTSMPFPCACAYSVEQSNNRIAGTARLTRLFSCFIVFAFEVEN
jgi:hypothetical protein